MGVLLLAPTLLVVPPVLAIDDTEDIAGVWTASGSDPTATSTVPQRDRRLRRARLLAEPRRRRRRAADDLDFRRPPPPTGTANLD